MESWRIEENGIKISNEEAIERLKKDDSKDELDKKINEGLIGLLQKGLIEAKILYDSQLAFRPKAEHFDSEDVRDD